MTAWTIGAAALVLAGAQSSMGTMPMSAGQEKVPVPAPDAMSGMAMAAPACPAVPAPLPALYAGWATMAPLVVGSDAAGAPMLAIGGAARLALADAAAVRFAVAPGHVPAPGSRGGMVALTVAAAGRYRVAIGAGAWVDMVGNGTALRSAAHSQGPACTGIRKLVDFDLQPGRYLLQLSGNAQPTLAVLVAKLPS